MGLNWMKSILEPDARTEKRHAFAGIVAYYWDGGAPRGFPVLNISRGGIYVLTEERWYPDTIIKIVLQRHPLHTTGKSDVGSEVSNRLCVLAQVVRTGPDGVGLKFVFAGRKHAAWRRIYPECTTDRRAIRMFLDRFINATGHRRAKGALDGKSVKKTSVSR